MHCVLIVGDGMADRPLQELNFRTPIEAANPKFMNRLACLGALGLLDPIAPGVVAGSDVANLTFLGYDSESVCKGRGPFEAAGVGLQLRQGDLAFRCNFVSVDEGLCLVDERADRIGGVEAEVLGGAVEQICLGMNSDVEVFFKQGLGFKGALVLRGDKLSCNVSAVLPNVGGFVGAVAPLDGSFEAKHTADVLNEFIQSTSQMLNSHPVNVERKVMGKRPANAVLPWSGSEKPEVMVPFQEKYGLKATCIAAASLIKGIGKFSGMSVPDVVGVTGELDTDTLAKADAALVALKGGNDFVYVHVEAPDEASHDGNVAGKVAIIQKIDALVGRIVDRVDLSDTVIVLASDHATSCRSMAHTGDAVPVCFAGVNVVCDGVTVYSERSAYKGGLGRIRGKDIMPMALSYMGKFEKLGG
ncbi:MAG: 2,3-bisphosphoglycerate-independent phosphoglycerate mutase [Nitrososphaerota archaeon]|jgi:2,3-bisphosphoglycerate-independent phosphoglycerate mutase|nr:2,3-bisphosphoglycerate-independent phosphoglycerate mutase [Nitrososphaerota archaeon]